MTHDELLKKLNKYYEDITSGQVWTTDVFIKALRAVVELHKPDLEGPYAVCITCQEIYPCGTIQIIEKELV